MTEEVNAYSAFQAKVDLYRDQIRKYTETLRKPSDDYSSVLPHVPDAALAAIRNPLNDARIRMAEERIKLELRSELLRLGTLATNDQLAALLDAIPREDFYRLIAARA